MHYPGSCMTFSSSTKLSLAFMLVIYDQPFYLVFSQSLRDLIFSLFGFDLHDVSDFGQFLLTLQHSFLQGFIDYFAKLWIFHAFLKFLSFYLQNHAFRTYHLGCLNSGICQDDLFFSKVIAITQDISMNHIFITFTSLFLKNQLKTHFPLNDEVHSLRLLPLLIDEILQGESFHFETIQKRMQFLAHQLQDRKLIEDLQFLLICYAIIEQRLKLQVYFLKTYQNSIYSYQFLPFFIDVMIIF